MLSARAYSFRQKSKLAISLSWIGGYVNVVLFVLCGAFSSHMTGNATQLGRAIGTADAAEIAHFGLLIVCFFLGAVASAIMTESAQRRGASSKYVLPMAAEGLLLAALAVMVNAYAGLHIVGQFAVQAMTFLAAFAMGLQNATITEISGAVIRTTHLTGVITDFGLEGVRLLNWYLQRVRSRRAWKRTGRLLKVSRRHPTAQRVGLLFCVFWSFVIGAAAGAWMITHHVNGALVPPVLFVTWIIVMDWRKPIADVRELDPLSDPELKAGGIVKSLLPPEMGLFRLTPSTSGGGPDRAHRPPDFTQWMELLPRRWRVIVLALSPWTRFDANSALNLREVVRRLRDEEHRTLILAGITTMQYQLLTRHGLLDVTEAENLCPDLELAIARGMELLREQSAAAADLVPSPSGRRLG